ncbi:LmbE family N-acetylglucosaminyl deacetylase [Actinocorallia herbida]|uniref:LmbE family N-acetylglucosaminyl deacetylase n=1 Tax=Actinocorallia herbida TaxID=58109 RepID=A0A3N1DBI7_9ACTN|nr:PIG-L family deacetylase [Actinocorallia herbida]ROO90880.1 LmbE family N-acetylglucosaminyl deacetylase [Actinocorallia herbida]
MLTLMAVHAHPDDEVIGTGGVFARAAALGIRTVLVTCTNGEQGDGPGGVKPGEEGHDPAGVRETRLKELARSAEILGIEHVELLGYADSGMVGWAANTAPGSFAAADLDAATDKLVALMEHYRPQVVVTYDANGNYGHPDHIQAHRVAVAAAERSGIPERLYATAMPRSAMAEMGRMAREQEWGLDWPELEEGAEPEFGTPDELVTTVVDVTEYFERKAEALQAHASQSDGSFLFTLPKEAQLMFLGHEAFSRIRGETTADTEDLFAGLT